MGKHQCHRSLFNELWHRGENLQLDERYTPKPDDGTGRAAWEKTNAVLYSILYLLLRGEAAGFVRKFRMARERHYHGIGAWEALVDNIEMMSAGRDDSGTSSTQGRV